MTDTSMPWVKLYTDLLDDRKLGRLPDVTKLRFIQLLLIAGECDAEGALSDGSGAMTVEDIAWRLRVDTTQLQEELRQIESVGLITNDGEIIITNFSKRQGRPQSVKREQWREAQQRHRDVIDDSNESNTPRGEERREEKRREEKEEEEEESATPFSQLQIAFINKTKLPALGIKPRDIEAIKHMEKAGVIPADIEAAVDELGDNYTIIGPASVQNAAINCMRKRTNQTKKKKEENRRYDNGAFAEFIQH